MGWLWTAFSVVCFLQRLAALELTVYPTVNPVWVLEGTPISLTCRVKGGKDVTPEWFKDFIPLTDYGFDTAVSRKSDTKGQVIEVNVTATKPEAYVDAYGIYLCQAGVREKMKNIHVFSVYLQNSNITVGEDVTITCDPQLSLEQLKVEWSKGGRSIHDIPDVSYRISFSNNNYTLTLHSAMANDSGEYTCNIIFLAGTPSQQSFLQTVKMFGKPFFPEHRISKSKVNVKRNSTIDLYCQVHGYPAPEVTWLKGDDILEPSDKVTIVSNKGEMMSHLQILDAQEGDVGDYMCNAENSLGRTYKKFKLTIPGVVNDALRVTHVLSHVVLFTMAVLLTVFDILV